MFFLHTEKTDVFHLQSRVHLIKIGHYNNNSEICFPTGKKLRYLKITNNIFLLLNAMAN